MESLLAIFSRQEFDLPILRKNMDYLQQLHDLFQQYIDVLYAHHVDEEILLDVNIITTQLIEVINLYYNGFIYQSYTHFKKFLKNYAFLLENDKTSHSTLYTNLSSLYRARVVSDYKEYTREDIFHVPFNRRTAIAQSRYSIAGYPSLYLSTSIELCHYESGGANNSTKIYAKYALNNEQCNNVVLFDCSRRPQDLQSFNADPNKVNDIENYIRVYPIVAAISFIKENQTQKFVPEYIIGQFMLQWLREKYATQQSLCGIKYFSSRSIANSNRGYNYVFSSDFTDHTSNNSHFCKMLSACWLITNPVIVSKDHGDLEDFELIAKELNEKNLEPV